jgi:hypothetical protein
MKMPPKRAAEIMKSLPLLEMIPYAKRVVPMISKKMIRSSSLDVLSGSGY